MKTSYPKEKLRVALLENIHPRAREMFEEEGFTVEAIAGSPEGQTLRDVVARSAVIGVRSKTRLTRELLDLNPRLLTVGCFCIGTDQVDLEGACKRGVAVFNSPFSNTRSVAELTIGQSIALLRRLFDKSLRLHGGGWDKSAEGCREVRGRTLGIVGYGHIGSQVSVLAEAMGMRVVFHDILSKLPLGNARACRSLDEVLTISDVVTLHVPDTAMTRGLIGAPELARMRPGAVLINNSRGTVVDVPALASALKEGRLGGAALDVFPVEPAGKGEAFQSELRGVANVILSPHIGGSTEEAQEAIAQDVASKLLAFINDGSTSGAVNVPRVELPAQPASDRPHRILHFHRNVPGVLRQIHGLISSLGLNVTAEHLQTNAHVGYAVLEVEPTEAGPIVEGLRAIPETIRVRVLW